LQLAPRACILAAQQKRNSFARRPSPREARHIIKRLVFVLKKLVVVLLFVVSLPALWITFDGVARVVFRPRFESVDLSTPPDNLAFVAAWTREDGEAGCRVFYQLDLLRYADSMPPVRMNLSESDLSVCAASVTYFRNRGQWPDSFSWARTGSWASVTLPNAGRLGLYEVTYSTDDADPTTRYEVDPDSGRLRGVEHNPGWGYGDGFGAAFVGGIGAVVAWLAILIWFVVTRWRARRNASTLREGARSSLE
jgi:hypothetical protein